MWSKPLSPSKLATQHRQKGINLLEKITKNMFRMFRNEETVPEKVIEKFTELKQQLDALGDIVLTWVYHREMMQYVEQLSHILAVDFDFDDLRWPQMTKLNRLQKLKNKGWYKRKEKHKKDKNER